MRSIARSISVLLISTTLYISTKPMFVVNENPRVVGLRCTTAVVEVSILNKAIIV